jgi:hypothetical protein
VPSHTVPGPAFASDEEGMDAYRALYQYSGPLLRLLQSLLMLLSRSAAEHRGAKHFPVQPSTFLLLYPVLRGVLLLPHVMPGTEHTFHLLDRWDNLMPLLWFRGSLAPLVRPVNVVWVLNALFQTQSVIALSVLLTRIVITFLLIAVFVQSLALGGGLHRQDHVPAVRAGHRRPAFRAVQPAGKPCIGYYPRACVELGVYATITSCRGFSLRQCCVDWYHCAGGEPLFSMRLLLPRCASICIDKYATILVCTGRHVACAGPSPAHGPSRRPRVLPRGHAAAQHRCLAQPDPR